VIYDPGNYYDPNTDSVHWNPHASLGVEDRPFHNLGYQSPALGLMHELGHAFGHGDNYIVAKIESPIARELRQMGFHEQDRANYGLAANPGPVAHSDMVFNAPGKPYGSVCSPGQSCGGP
jgi:hypothetical protein